MQAIARAVYSRKPVAVFDDVFSGLDKVTEQAVFAQVFAKGGLLQKNGTTIILATHAGMNHGQRILNHLLNNYNSQPIARV